MDTQRNQYEDERAPNNKALCMHEARYILCLPLPATTRGDTAALLAPVYHHCTTTVPPLYHSCTTTAPLFAPGYSLTVFSSKTSSTESGTEMAPVAMPILYGSIKRLLCARFSCSEQSAACRGRGMMKGAWRYPHAVV